MTFREEYHWANACFRWALSNECKHVECFHCISCHVFVWTKILPNLKAFKKDQCNIIHTIQTNNNINIIKIFFMLLWSSCWMTMTKICNVCNNHADFCQQENTKRVSDNSRRHSSYIVISHSWFYLLKL